MNEEFDSILEASCENIMQKKKNIGCILED